MCVIGYHITVSTKSYAPEKSASASAIAAWIERSKSEVSQNAASLPGSNSWL